MQGEPSDSISLHTLRARTANAATPMDRVASTSSLNRAASRAAQRRQFLAANAGSSSLSSAKGKERDSDADDVDLLGSSQSAPAAREDETRLLLGEGEPDGDFDAGWQNGTASTSDARVRAEPSCCVAILVSHG